MVSCGTSGVALLELHAEDFVIALFGGSFSGRVTNEFPEIIRIRLEELDRQRKWRARPLWVRTIWNILSPCRSAQFAASDETMAE